MRAIAGASVGGAVLEHANRGVRMQLLLRVALAAFMALTIALVPPVQSTTLCALIVGAYAVGAVAFALWAWRGGAVVARWAWLGLFVDLAVLATVTLVAGVDANESWTSDVLVNGFFVIPVLAATQLRPIVCAAVVIPTIVVYLVSSVATQSANEEPSVSIVLRTLVLAGLGAGCVRLSAIQRSRVAAIARLLEDRTALLDDLVQVEDHQRRELSERLHDGALQYVLGARLDLDDVRDGADPDAVARIERALTESSQLLRSTVSELHPAVLEQAGLARAVTDLAHSQGRGGLVVDVDVDAWPEGTRTPVDPLLFGAARELLGNVVKHAGASSARITLGLDDGWARLEVVDDGRGIGADDQQRSIDRGHIGLHAQTRRLEAAGGTLTVTGSPSGTIAVAEVPI